MELLYDDLLFDNRNRDDLFGGFQSRQPLYADIIKRWMMGIKVSESELSIVTSILIFYPEYVLKNDQAEEFIELIQYSLRQPVLNKQSDQERGLLLYNLFFLLLRLEKREESLRALDMLEKFLPTFSNCYNPGNNTHKSISDTNYVKRSDVSGCHSSNSYQKNAYIEIITRIMNESGILSLKPGFNISHLPVPQYNFSREEGYNLRSQAFIHYTNKELDKASEIYQRLLVHKFELPGTLAHLVRLEISRINKTKAEIFVVNAWRLRTEAPMYVMARILFLIIFIKMLRSEQFKEWLGCLKYVLNQPGSRIYWEMSSILTQYEKELIPVDLNFLRSLLEVISGIAAEVKLDKFEIWKDATTNAFEEWPDYNIVI